MARAMAITGRHWNGQIEEDKQRCSCAYDDDPAVSYRQVARSLGWRIEDG